jgi:hypothetical protein
VSEIGPPRDDRPGDRPSCALFAESLEKAGQFRFAECCQEIRRGRPLRGIKPHIEGAAALNAEAPRRVGQLVRRKPQVEQHAVDLGDSQRIKDFGQLCITGRPQGRTGVGQHARRQREHHRIAIEGDQFSVESELFQDEFAVTTAADRAVDHHASRSEVQKLEDLPG